MSTDLIEYLKRLDKSIKNKALSQMIKQRIDLYDQATYLRDLMAENRTSAIYINAKDPLWVKNNEEFLRILRQQECIRRASIDLDQAIVDWVDNAPEDIKPILRTIKVGAGYNE